MPLEIDRRRFLTQTAAASLAAAVVPRVHSAELAAMPIIDTHQHLWDISKFKLAWMKPGSKLSKNFLSDDYKTATEGLNVVKAVYMEVDVEPSQQGEELESILELIRSGKTPTAAAVVSGRPASEGFGEWVARLKRSKEIKGIRQVLHGEGTPNGYCLDPKFVNGMKTLGDAGLMFDLCIRPADLLNAAKLVHDCPGTNFILDHCGNPEFLSKDTFKSWRSDIDKLADNDNVVCKVSGIVASLEGKTWKPDDLAPVVNHVLDAFGPDNVMFGGDWPVCTLGASFQEWVAALKTIVSDRPAVLQNKLFHGNATRIYGL